MIAGRKFQFPKGSIVAFDKAMWATNGLEAFQNKGFPLLLAFGPRSYIESLNTEYNGRLGRQQR
jgi:hypothetical protein